MALCRVTELRLVWHEIGRVVDERVGEWAPADAVVRRWHAEAEARGSSDFLTLSVQWEGGLEYVSRVAIYARQYTGPTLAAWLRREIELIARPPEHPTGLAPHEWRVLGFPFTAEQRRECGQITETCSFDDLSKNDEASSA